MPKCAVCKQPFEKYNSLQKVCKPVCAIEYAKKKQEKKAKTEHLALKRKVRENSRGYQLQKAQEAFNRYIRLRDALEPCISCGRQHQGKWNAGHYRTVKAYPELRFNELNCHKQCEPCNSHLSGNIVEYRIRLREKIGDKALDWLEGPHMAQKLAIEEIKGIKEYYKDKLKQLDQ